MITLQEPLDCANVVVMPGVDPEKPGIYMFVVDRLGIYVGKYKRSSRYLKEYSRNVQGIREGTPYRQPKRSYRRIHRALYEALDRNLPISLVLLENVGDGSKRSAREKELIKTIGSLNCGITRRSPRRTTTEGVAMQHGFWAGHRFKAVPNATNTFGENTHRYNRIELLKEYPNGINAEDFMRACNEAGYNRPKKQFFSAAISKNLLRVLNLDGNDVSNLIQQKIHDQNR